MKRDKGMKITMKMKKSTTGAIAVAIGALLLLFSVVLPASATTVDECIAAINVVQGDLAGVNIVGINADRTRAGLNSKLDGAKLKLQQGKFNDALQKMTDFKSAVVTKASAGKITDGTTTVAQLLADTDTAIDCINSLITQ
jgi:hypothetical protein